ncbi:Gfo/Idh/MocA family oxidoreductase [Terribacillus saccharophilus]|uniref:Gfo/Idh/MocA family protein n=1 Tax=Terribacillus saccharophilus TaxID=361277 RepID=UPI003982C49B
MVRFGVIGTNWITESFIAAGRKVKDFELTAVYSRKLEKAEEFASKHKAVHTFTDIEQMAKSKEIDAAYIASPNALHAEQAKILMQHGVHVLCEKPLASNVAEVKDLIETAKQHDVLLMEAMKSTFLPNFQEVKKHLGKIGTVRRYVAQLCQYSSRYDAYRQGTILNAFNPELSNGATMDIGIYCLYPLAALFGKPKEIKASGTLLESGVDGQATITLTYEEMEAVVYYSKITSSTLPSEIQGEDATIMIDHIGHFEDVKIQYHDSTEKIISGPQDNDHRMFYEIEEFVNLIQSGKRESSINTHELALTVAEIMEKARIQFGLIYPADRLQ